VCDPEGRTNRLADCGEAALEQFKIHFPRLEVHDTLAVCGESVRPIVETLRLCQAVETGIEVAPLQQLMDHGIVRV